MPGPGFWLFLVLFTVLALVRVIYEKVIRLLRRQL